MVAKGRGPQLPQERFAEDLYRLDAAGPNTHVVFTVPEQLVPLALKNQRLFYSLLFQAASSKLTTGRRWIANCAVHKFFRFYEPGAGRAAPNTFLRVFHQGRDGAESLLLSTANAAIFLRNPSGAAQFI
jgi:hypothetical protein